MMSRLSASPIPDLSQRLASAVYTSTSSRPRHDETQLTRMMQEAEELEKSLALASVGGMKALGFLQNNRQVSDTFRAVLSLKHFDL